MTPVGDDGVSAGPYPLMLICHENRGLTVHIRDVTRRFATNGYLTCAVDLLSREGDTDAVEDPSVIPAILVVTSPTSGRRSPITASPARRTSPGSA